MIQADALKGAAITILQKSRTPLHFERIADRALTQKIILLGANVFDDYMGAVLRHDVEQYGSRSAFVKTAPGYYGLNPDRASNMPDAEMEKSMPKTAEFKKAAIRILRGSLGSLHFGHIASKAISEGIIQPTSHTVAALMGEVLHNDILQNGVKSPFVTTDRGFYRLRPNHPLATMLSTKYPKQTPTKPHRRVHPQTTVKFGVSFPANVQTRDLSMAKTNTKPSFTQQQLHKLPATSFGEYVGKGGEYLVASKLFFLNYNVSMPGVDVGADLLATKDGHSHYYIQVKTMFKRKSTYRTRIKISSFKKRASNCMFYVFVLRSLRTDQTITENFLIFSHAALEEHMLCNHIKSDDKHLFLAFNQDDGRFSIGSHDDYIDNHVNDWNLIGQDVVAS